MPTIAPSIDLRRLGALEAASEAAAAAWHGASQQADEAGRTLSALRQRKDHLLATQPFDRMNADHKKAALDEVDRQMAVAGGELREARGAVEDAQERLDAANALRDACRSYVGAAR